MGVEKAEKLAGQQIPQTNSKRAGTVYLLARSTAENCVEAPVDEVNCLASGFQVAGFSHVIAFMWSADHEIHVGMAGIRRAVEEWLCCASTQLGCGGGGTRSILSEWRRYLLL